MNFLEMQTLVGDTVDDPNFGYFTLPIVKQRLNLAQRELQGLLVRAGHSYYTKCVKTNTVNGQKAYSLPNDFYSLKLIEKVVSGSGDTVNTNSIGYISPNERYQIAELSGDPTAYYFEKNNLIFKPCPSRVQEIHLEYFYQVVNMVADGDTPDAPEQYHEYIPVLAAKKCFLKDARPLAPIQEDLNRLELQLKSIADTRRLDGPRMTIMTDNFGY